MEDIQIAHTVSLDRIYEIFQNRFILKNLVNPV